MKVPAWQWLTFYPVLLAIVLFIVDTRIELRSLPAVSLSIIVTLSLIFAGISTVIVVFFSFVSVTIFRKVSRKLLSKITLHTLRKVDEFHSRKVEAIGIGSKDGELAIGLSAGANDGVTVGTQYWLATVTGDALGILEVFEVSETTCLCGVFDMINVDFWEGLEARMIRDSSPPSGVTVTGYVPEESIRTVRQLLKNWEESK